MRTTTLIKRTLKKNFPTMKFWARKQKDGGYIITYQSIEKVEPWPILDYMKEAFSEEDFMTNTSVIAKTGNPKQVSETRAIKARLKVILPEIKFSVRKKAKYSAIISWTDSTLDVDQLKTKINADKDFPTTVDNLCFNDSKGSIYARDKEKKVAISYAQYAQTDITTLYKPEPEGTPVIAAIGGGVNSTAMAIALTLKGQLPDMFAFADTMAEKPETYEHLHKLSDWLEENAGMKIHMIKKDHMSYTKKDNTPYYSLEDLCKVHHTLPSKTYNTPACTIRFKMNPLAKYVRQYFNIPRGGRCLNLVGIHADEANRALKVLLNPNNDDTIFTPRYPLIEWGFNQANCISMNAYAGFSNVPKSSCFFCPNSRINEVIALKENHPDLYERACEMEKNAHMKGSIKGLGRSWAWSDIDNLTPYEIESIKMRGAARKCGCTD